MMQCYCAAARRVARRLTRMYEMELRGAGMNPAQFELMSYLRARPGVGQAALAEALDVDQTTLSRNVRLLAAQGWVTVSAGVKDKRVSTYALSEAGGRRCRWRCRFGRGRRRGWRGRWGMRRRCGECWGIWGRRRRGTHSTLDGEACQAWGAWEPGLDAGYAAPMGIERPSGKMKRNRLRGGLSM